VKFVKCAPIVSELSIDPISKTKASVDFLDVLLACGKRLLKLKICTCNGYAGLNEVGFDNLTELEIFFDNQEKSDIEMALKQFKNRDKQIALTIHFEDKIIFHKESLQSILETLDFFRNLTLASLIYYTERRPISIPTIKVRNL
jgi:hypothetical protein